MEEAILKITIPDGPKEKQIASLENIKNVFIGIAKITNGDVSGELKQLDEAIEKIKNS